LSKPNPRFTDNCGGAVLLSNGPIIIVTVQPGHAHRLILGVRGERIPEPLTLRMLVDTGAHRSVVPPRVIERLDLPVVSTDVDLRGVTGSVRRDVHFGSVTFSFPEQQQTLEVPGTFVAQELDPEYPFDGLLGRELLEPFELTFSIRDGYFRLRKRPKPRRG
jgi:predicted aspartyl protease